MAFTLAALMTFTAVLRFDFRSEPRVGDSMAFLFQAVSLAYGQNLSFDQSDLDRYDHLAWNAPPHGLFIQRFHGGWASAKPYGYSLWLAPFLRLFGPYPGIALANAALLAGLLAVAIALLRLRYAGAVVPITAGTFVIGSYAVFYAFPIHPDLFLSFVTGISAYAGVRAYLYRSFVWGCLAVATAAFLISQKTPHLVVLSPLVLVVLVAQANWKRRAAIVVLGAATLIAACLPYHYYSDGRSWTPYGGERYYVFGTPPFDREPQSGEIEIANTGEMFAPAFIIRSALGSVRTPELGPLSLAYYGIGRHTGVLLFMPMAPALVLLAMRRSSRMNQAGWALLVGIATYVLFYVLLFPTNYYGGGASLGNRYFLQMAPMVLAVAACAPIPPRHLIMAGLASAFVTLMFLWPHYLAPEESLRRIDRVSPLQRLFPFERNQAAAEYFRCGSLGCPEPPNP